MLGLVSLLYPSVDTGMSSFIKQFLLQFIHLKNAGSYRLCFVPYLQDLGYSCYLARVPILKWEKGLFKYAAPAACNFLQTDLGLRSWRKVQFIRLQML